MAIPCINFLVSFKDKASITRYKTQYNANVVVYFYPSIIWYFPSFLIPHWTTNTYMMRNCILRRLGICFNYVFQWTRQIWKVHHLWKFLFYWNLTYIKKLGHKFGWICSTYMYSVCKRKMYIIIQCTIIKLFINNSEC